MKIAIIGYGKMGKAIEKIALKNGDEIVLKINSSNTSDLTTDNLKKADVAIEFTNPKSAVLNLIACLKAKTPVVTGSTGWYDELPELEKFYKTDGSLLYAPNFSIGVNLFFALNKQLASLMNKFESYDVNMKEAHHTQKLDSPSGTALHLANDLIDRLDRKSSWREVKKELIENKATNDLFIKAIREENVIGEHEVIYNSEIDEISIKHTAHNRQGFANGALLAAKWLQNKTGFYTMSDMLELEAK
ncbi:MAG: 4-hydroxy-tetrahydrodipicolinate reductase [Bacteroidia bacterium]|nr:4-hydroxy-tetrahydrodipicolinate reductase [Bacteroidia bacterium]NNM15932.1 4-hydroxy-tetrahydrodipicolinate reductase [Bacteroidia bacterium]